MKILFIVPYVPNLVRVRPFNLIRSLAKRGHQITLATLVSEESEMADFEALRPFCQQILWERLPRWRSFTNAGFASLSDQPLQASYCWSPSFARKIACAVDEGTDGKGFDIVHVEHLRGARYGLAMSSAGGTRYRPPVVWDSVDCISHLFRQAAAKSKNGLSRALARFELKRTERYESWLAGQFTSVLVTSPVDREAFLSLPGKEGQKSPIYVLPNGVDVDYFKPGNVQREPATVVVTGKMSYHANVTMTLNLLQEIMPLVWSRRPDARVMVVGKNPPREIQALANPATVTVTGTVKDIPAFLQKSTISAAPIQYGAGIQNKVLEAMATATPVVTTPQGISALSVMPDRDLMVAGDPQSFADSILYLLDHPQACYQMGRAGREYVEAHYRWDRIASQLEEIYQETIDCYSFRAKAGGKE